MSMQFAKISLKNRWLLVALGNLLLGCQPATQAPETSWSQLLSSEQQFQQASPARPVQFPADHAAHPEYGIEWWYLTATLQDAAGAPYGIQWTLFRRALANTPGEQWQTPQLFMAHAALSDGQGHRFAQKYARGGVGQAGVQSQPFAAWLDSWQLASSSSARYPMTVTASGEDFSYRLTLHNQPAPYLQGKAGFSQKHGSGVGSYYYSEPFIRAQGELRFGDTVVPVSGQAWLDHEWSSQFLSPQQLGWDWFALALDEHTRLMLFQLRQRDGQHFRYARLMYRDGRQSQIAPEHIQLSPEAYTQISAQKQLPEVWRLTIPASQNTAAIKLRIKMHHPEQWMATDFPYWEGMVEFSGSHSGRGYLEMTDY